MNFGFLNNIPWVGAQLNKDRSTLLTNVLQLNTDTTALSSTVVQPGKDMAVISTSSLIDKRKQNVGFDLRLWVCSLLSLVPWAMNAKNKILVPTTVNKGLKKHSKPLSCHSVVPASSHPNMRFRPYVSKVPWHTGPRAFLSQFFPRYGHYCGPNWSSGKDGGSHVWDKRPIDWLDFCCYCHDIGYDTHDQAELLKADLAFLECLEKPMSSTKGDAHVAHMYKTMCISGLRNILIPYRNHLVKLQCGRFTLDFGWIGNVTLLNWKSFKLKKG